MSDTYQPPDSSPDPYSTPSTPPFDTTSLPRPLPILGPLTGYTPTKLSLSIQNRLQLISHQLSRPLTPSESAALAHHSARAAQIASLGPPLGIGIALYRTYATRADFRWPLYGKIISDELGTGFWDGEKMRVNGKEILANVSREGKANILHATRGMAYVSVGMLFVPLVVSSYAAAVASVSELRDQRLRDVVKGLAAQAQAQREERVAKMREQRGEVGASAHAKMREQRGEVGGVTPTNSNTTGQRGDVWRERRERREKIGGRGRGERQDDGDVDDMSPTGGAMLDYGLDDNSQGDNSGMMSDVQLQQSQVQPSSPRTTSTSAFPKKQSTRSPSPSSYDNDDASPTSGRGIFDDISSDSTDATGLSAWERIRQQNASGENTSSPSAPSSSGQMRRGSRKAGGQQQQEDGGDGFSFSGEEEERGYARAEAQREFDERLERERRGGSFGGNE